MNPAKIQSLLQQAVTQHRAGNFAAAEQFYRQVRAAAPKNFDALHLSGVLALHQGRVDDAISLLLRAHQVDRASVLCQSRLGIALMSAGKAADAEAHFRAALKRDPKAADTWDALGCCLRLLDRLPEAAGCHQRAVELAPNSAIAWHNSGLTYSLLGYPEKALPCHERALTLDPASIDARASRAHTLHQLNRMADAIAEYDRVLATAPDRWRIRSARLFALHHVDGVTREQLFADHVAAGRALGGEAGIPFANARGADRRLRLAILSPDLRQHSCAYFLLPLLEHLDPREFELCLYHDHFRSDAVSARFQKLATIWRNFSGVADSDVEKTIRADAPDILVDLAGHTGLNCRLALLARRLAPVQVTYLGYPNTTGVAAIDYRFTDAVADPAGAEAFATERLIRFAPTAWAYAPPPDALEPRLASADRPVTFGCFNAPAKWTDAMFRVWAELLGDVPGSRLLLKGSGLDLEESRAYWSARLRAAGLPPDRVTFLPRTDTTAEHLACYHQVDVALDTSPYHGTTTTCEALWMGVPVVTLAGDRHVSRVGVSLLTAVDHPEWIADTPADYIRIAAALAARRAPDTPGGPALRDDLRRSALLDHRAQSARFAAALRACWVDWSRRVEC